jgi:hypothetical protein
MVTDTNRSELSAVDQTVKRLFRYLQQLAALRNREELLKVRRPVRLVLSGSSECHKDKLAAVRQLAGLSREKCAGVA